MIRKNSKKLRKQNTQLIQDSEMNQYIQQMSVENGKLIGGTEFDKLIPYGGKSPTTTYHLSPYECTIHTDAVCVAPFENFSPPFETNSVKDALNEDLYSKKCRKNEQQY